MLSFQDRRRAAEKAAHLAQFLLTRAAVLEDDDRAIVDQLQDMIDRWDKQPTLEDLFELRGETFSVYAETTNPQAIVHRFLLHCLEASRKLQPTGLKITTAPYDESSVEIKSDEYAYSLLITPSKTDEVFVYTVVVSVND